MSPGLSTASCKPNTETCRRRARRLSLGDSDGGRVSAADNVVEVEVKVSQSLFITWLLKT
ncbi:hypothetical protein TorRG33x02_344840 [Trema orientale]|uniref:Uncharacterized protein n=1 Tax=Trema orientale TaxID=63057 RepID=A0A2P5APL9_TREOI|nr:hypothetical protein TorRG33x02_344840 [Trema orientale]